MELKEKNALIAIDELLSKAKRDIELGMKEIEETLKDVNHKTNTTKYILMDIGCTLTTNMIDIKNAICKQLALEEHKK